MIDLNTIITKSQKKLKKYLNNELKQIGYSPILRDGFLYAKGTIPILLVAHMDTVHSDNVSVICTSPTGILMSPQGIGGDDRCGIYMVMKMIEELKCHVLFTEDEEIGCIGAHKFTKSNLLPDVKYCIEFDRKGSNDAVFYDCDNEEFEEFITGFGFKHAYGSCSDISVIAPYLGVAAVNLSCGFYNAHTKHEHIDLKIVEKNIQRVKEIIRRNTDKFIYIEKVYASFNNFYEDDWWKDYYLYTNDNYIDDKEENIIIEDYMIKVIPLKEVTLKDPYTGVLYSSEGIYMDINTNLYFEVEDGILESLDLTIVDSQVKFKEEEAIEMFCHF